MNLPTLIVLIAVAVAFIAVVVALVRRRRHCADGCSGCPYRDNCSH